MKIGAIIAEYNPFHNGHKYQLDSFRSSQQLDYIVVIMSGNFTQRGNPAWMPKHLRTAMALDGGADLVIELPTCYATGSAQIFSDGAIAHLNALGCIDSLCFGCECETSIKDHLTLLMKAAEFLENEPNAFKKTLSALLKIGYPYPSARFQALKSFLPNMEILEKPNNILALEYIRSLKRSNSSIQPFPIPRKGADYHSKSLSSTYASASGIRHFLNDPKNLDLMQGLSEFSKRIILENYKKTLPMDMDDFSLVFSTEFLNHRLHLESYTDMNSDLKNRMLKSFDHFTCLSAFMDEIKTKSLTHTRISRCVSHIITHQTESLFHPCVSDGFAYYARILGFKKEATELLACIKHHSSIPMITKPSSYKNVLYGNGLALFENDLYASQLYRFCAQNKYHHIQKNEFSHPIVLL